MLDKIKKNYFILIITFLFIYFFFNLLGGDIGLISYIKKKEIYEDLKIKQNDLRIKIQDLFITQRKSDRKKHHDTMNVEYLLNLCFCI